MSATATEPMQDILGQEKRVLVCDDEKNMRRLLVDVLEDDGWKVDTAASGEEAIEKLKGEESFPTLVLDLSLPGMSGLDVLKKIRESRLNTNVVVITAYGTVDVAVKAMQAGAADFIVKPFDNVRIRAAMRKCAETRDMVARVEMSHPQFVGADNSPLFIVGSDKRLNDVFNVIRRIASLRAPVLIHGESGTGKELVAQAIHYNGARRDEPFVAINCAALPETLLESEFFGHERGAFTGAHALQRGKFEIASGGTLFLDEIGDMPLSLQVKLLRVLQEQRFTRVGGEKELATDVRLIAATNRNLEEAIASKSFREDLYYRLNVVPIHLPPLRDRREDIPQMVEFFLARFSTRHGLPVPEVPRPVMDELMGYPWPGNIRELQNVVEKAIILQDPQALVDPIRRGRNDVTPRPVRIPETPSFGGPSTPSRIPPSEDEFLLNLGPNGEIRDLSDVAADAQRGAVIRALKLCHGNKAEAAKRLGVSYKTLFNKIHELGISISTKFE